MRTAQKITLGIVVLGFIVSLYAFPNLPDTLISHWNASGQANGTMEKPIALFLVPAISALLFVLFYFIPRMDPLRKNYGYFIDEYDIFIGTLIAFLLYIHIIVIAVNSGVAFNTIQAISPAFAALFFSLGVMSAKSRRNYFAGIRTPWTLASDRVWERTHKLGSKLFKACGAVALAGLILPQFAFILIIAPILATVVALVTYSYLEYAKENRAFKK